MEDSIYIVLTPNWLYIYKFITDENNKGFPWFSYHDIDFKSSSMKFLKVRAN
jgi:hypothetical protein